MILQRFKLNKREIHFKLDKKTWKWNIYDGQKNKPIMSVTHAKGNAIIRFLQVLLGKE